MESIIHIVPPQDQVHSHTFILLHGRDSTATEFSEELFESQASDGHTLRDIFPTVKWVFPNSKIRNSARFETGLSQWFDMWSVENPSEREEIQIEGMRESIEEIFGIIRYEASLVPAERIILGGISQGCAVAIIALIVGGIRLGGFIGLCSWLPFQNQLTAQNTTSTYKGKIRDLLSNLKSSDGKPKDIPDLSDLSGLSDITTSVFLSHSQDDDVVPFENGRKLYEILTGYGFPVIWKAYEDGGHWVNEPQGIDDLVKFLHGRMQVGL